MKILIASSGMDNKSIRRQPWFYIYSVAKALYYKGHDVYILTNKNKLNIYGIETIFFKSFRKPIIGIKKSLLNLIEKEKFDLLIWPIGLTDFFFFNNLKDIKIPVFGIVTSPKYSLKELLSLKKDLIHDWSLVKRFFIGPLISKKRLKKILEAHNLKVLIFESKYNLMRYFPSPKISQKEIKVIPPPLPDDFLRYIRTLCNKKIRKDFTNYKILYLGPPLNIRGLELLIKAIDIARHKTKDLKLIILSRTENKNLYKKAKKLENLVKKKNLTCHVKFLTGVIPSQKVVEHICHSDLVCLPFKMVVSDVPISVLEVLATGTPLITTKIGISDDFAKEHAILIEPNYKVIADKIIELKTTNIKPKKSKNKYLLNYYCMERFANDYENLLKLIKHE